MSRTCQARPVRLFEPTGLQLFKKKVAINQSYRSKVLSTQLSALEEIVWLAIDDSVIREIFNQCRLEFLETSYKEHDLLLKTSKALASIKEASTHELWFNILRHSKRELYDLRDLIESSLLYVII